MSRTLGSAGKLTPKKSVRLAYWIHSCANEGPDRNRIDAAVMTEIRRMFYPPLRARSPLREGERNYSRVSWQYRRIGLDECERGRRRLVPSAAAHWFRDRCSASVSTSATFPPRSVRTLFLLERLQLRLSTFRNGIAVGVQEHRHRVVPPHHANQIHHPSLTESILGGVKRGVAHLLGIQ